jgi:1-acyl-sn-glycerol-3-phosphate acyltransferase
MNTIRSVLWIIIMIVTIIPYALMCFVWAVLPLHWRFKLTVGWPSFALWLTDVLCGVKVKVEGWENLPAGAAIILSKHQSTWETFFCISRLNREVCFVFKREILFIPFFGWGIGLLKMIHIDRRKGRDAFEEVVVQGREKLASGRSIVMFPEGTRIPVGQQGQYKSGGARLAVRTQALVVPIAHNAGECWPRKKWILKPGLVTVSIGKPIPPGDDPDVLNKQVEAWIETEMRRLSPHRYSAPWKS